MSPTSYVIHGGPLYPYLFVSGTTRNDKVVFYDIRKDRWSLTTRFLRENFLVSTVYDRPVILDISKLYLVITDKGRNFNLIL